MGFVACHTVVLFGKSPLSIISFDFLHDSFTRALPLLSFLIISAFIYVESPPQSAIFRISHAAHASSHDNTRMQY